MSELRFEYFTDLELSLFEYALDRIDGGYYGLFPYNLPKPLKETERSRALKNLIKECRDENIRRNELKHPTLCNRRNNNDGNQSAQP